MKTIAFHRFITCAALPLVLGSYATARAEATNTTFHIAPPALVKSVFVNEPQSGKDPFFPNSTRRLEGIEQAPPTNSAPQPSDLFAKLALKGISGTPGQMLALINSSTVGVGKSAEIRCGRNVIRIRCLEIRDRSVLIELEATSEKKELRLRNNI